MSKGVRFTGCVASGFMVCSRIVHLLDKLAGDPPFACCKELDVFPEMCPSLEDGLTLRVYREQQLQALMHSPP